MRVAGKKEKGGTRKIMLVDDEADINAALRVVLRRGGFDIVTFEDPIDALEKFEPGFYDLLIIDVKMPNMDGFELYEKIKGIDEQAKACFLTASELYYEKFREEKYQNFDKSLFIRKPISNSGLIDKINSILDADE